jgi:hypothetical protein
MRLQRSLGALVRAFAASSALALLTAGCAHATAPAVLPTDFNVTDRAWVQLMIPMDEQLLPALELAITRSESPSARTLATQLRDALRVELVELHRLGQLAELPSDNPHRGHKMPGLVDGDTLASLRLAAADAFDPLFAQILRVNLEQTRSLARSEQTAGLQPDTMVLAATVEQTRLTHTASLDRVAPSPTP